MYVDGSGDSGIVGSPSPYFTLTGLVIHELRWKEALDELTDFRRRIKDKYGFHLREEIHASEFICRGGRFRRIPKHERLAIIRLHANQLSTMTYMNLINIVVIKHDKSADYDVFGMAWTALVQRFSNTMERHNFPGPTNPDDTGILICDNTDNDKVRAVLRKMRRYNPISHDSDFGPGYRDVPIRIVIEDPNFRDSADSYFVQAADTAAYLLYQHVKPNRYMKIKRGDKYFRRLQPILCLHASRDDPYGIVWL
jgi:hypothetical protein